MNAVASLACTGTLPTERTNSVAAVAAASSVRMVRTTSTSFMSGTGLKKCMPITWPGRLVAAASAVTLHDDVLLASRAWGGQIRSSLAKVSFFSGWFSVIASITRSLALRSSRRGVPAMRPSVSSVALASSLPLATRPSSVSRRRPSPRVTSSSLASTNSTEYPAWAATCTMPEPMSPQPITPTFLMGMAMPSLPNVGGEALRGQRRRPGRGRGSKNSLPGGQSCRMITVVLPYLMLPSGCTTGSSVGLAGGPAPRSDSSKARSRDCVGGLVMSRMIEPLTGVLASSWAAAAAGRTTTSASAPSVVVRMIRMLLIVDDERVHGVRLKFLTSAQEGQLDHEGHADHAAAQLLHQSQGGGHGAAGGEQIVHREDTLARPDGILVHGQRVAPVLELVLDLDRLGRQLAELAHGDEARLELMRDGAAEDEATRLDAHHQVDPVGLVPVGQRVDSVAPGGAILEQGRDVLEQDA